MHCSSMCDSGSLLKPLEIGNLWIFLYFLVPKKPSLVALGNPLSLIHATWTGFIKFLKTRRWEEKIEDTVKVVIGVLLVGQEGERGWQSYKCRELPALNPFRDLCNNPRVCESPMKGVNHTSQYVWHPRQPWVKILCKEVTWSTCSSHGPWEEKRERRDGWILICREALASKR